MFAIEADVLTDFTTWQRTRCARARAASFFLADHIPLRAGYRYDEGMNTHAVSGGLGYIGQLWSIEYSLRRDIAGAIRRR